jgi:hypothetical protein
MYGGLANIGMQGLNIYQQQQSPYGGYGGVSQQSYSPYGQSSPSGVAGDAYMPAYGNY